MAPKREPPIDVVTNIIVIGIIGTKHIHTRGMAAFGQPELCLDNVPMFLHPFATMFLNHLADFMLNSGEVFKAGERVGFEDPPSRFKLVDNGRKDQGNPMWDIEDVAGAYVCEMPGHDHGHAHQH